MALKAEKENELELSMIGQEMIHLVNVGQWGQYCVVYITYIKYKSLHGGCESTLLFKCLRSVMFFNANAHQGCIYVITNTVKINIVKYYYN